MARDHRKTQTLYHPTVALPGRPRRLRAVRQLVTRYRYLIMVMPSLYLLARLLFDHFIAAAPK